MSRRHGYTRWCPEEVPVLVDTLMLLLVPFPRYCSGFPNGTEILQSLPNGTKVFENLPNSMTTLSPVAWKRVY